MIKFEITLDQLEEMAHCIHDCSWVSSEEIAAYMKSTVTGGTYEPEDWSVNGRGLIAKELEVINAQL